MRARAWNIAEMYFMPKTTRIVTTNGATKVRYCAIDIWPLPPIKNSSLLIRLSRVGKGRRSLCDQAWRQFDIEFRNLKVIQRLAIRRQLELAAHQTRRLELLQMQVQQRATDADFPGQLTHVLATVRGEHRHYAQPVRIGQRGQRGQQAFSR